MFRKIQLHTVDTAALAKEEFELLVALIGTSGAFRSMKLLYITLGPIKPHEGSAHVSCLCTVSAFSRRQPGILGRPTYEGTFLSLSTGPPQITDANILLYDVV